MADGDVTIKDQCGQEMFLRRHGGRLFPRLPNLLHNLDHLGDLKVRNDDVILLAYPRSGTHWLWEISNQLLNGKAESVKGVKLELFIEMADFATLDKMASPRVINTHVYPDMFQIEQLRNRKLIFVTRNPKDSLVSKYYHVFNVSGIYQYDGSFPSYFELMMKDACDFGRWWDYTLAWEKYFADHPELDVIYLHYEDLKENLESGVRKLANHLGVEADESLIRDVTKMCTFQQMKADKTAGYPHDNLKVWREGEYREYRKGEVGDWKNHFTVAMNERFDLEHDRLMGQSKIASNTRFTL